MATQQLTDSITARVRRARRYRRIALWSVVFIFVAAMVLPLGGYVYTGIRDAQAQTASETNPRANYWREVRKGISGYSAVNSAANDEANVLIQNGGQNYRRLRNGIVANYGGWIIFGVAVALMLFFAWKGRLDIEHGASGRYVKRWAGYERFLHWTTATLFVILAITGLSLLFGRAVLIPLMGPHGFAAWAQIAKGLHNWGGPIFSVGVLLMVILWLRHNLPSKEDLTWLAQGGGIFGKAHPSAGFANAGEKIWFWFIVVFGGAGVIATGFLLDFPNIGTVRADMQFYQLVHAACGLAWIAFWLGHAYIGSIGSQGSLQGMTTGYVDVNWAKQHHDKWYEELEQQGTQTASEPPPSGARQPA